MPERKIQQIMQEETQAPIKSEFIYVPSIKLYVARKRTLLGKTWDETHRELQAQNLKMPAIPEFIAFLNYLKEDYQKIDKKEADSILDDILKIRDPWRAEWLDARFENEKIIYHKLINGKLQEVAENIYKNTLMEDRLPGISLEEWLENPTSQGLPRKNISQGEGYYWFPRNEHVAEFSAFSSRTGLYCRRYHSCKYPSLGVFGCTEGTKKNL